MSCADQWSAYGLPTSNAYLPGFSREYRELTTHAQWTWLGPYAGLFGSRYLVKDAADAGDAVVARDAAAGAVVVDLPWALPRAYLASGIIRVGRAGVPLALKSAAFVPGAMVLLDADAPGPAARPVSAPMVPAVVKRLSPSELEITATAEGPTVLVLNEAYFQGARAFEGERELQLLRVNHVVRGVALEPGAHTVRFTFATPGLVAGAAVSAAALALLAAAWWLERRRPRSPGWPGAASRR